MSLFRVDWSVPPDHAPLPSAEFDEFRAFRGGPDGRLLLSGALGREDAMVGWMLVFEAETPEAARRFALDAPMSRSRRFTASALQAFQLELGTIAPRL